MARPSTRKRRPKKPARQDPASALLASLDDTFTEAERRQILAGALLALDRTSRARLCDQLGATGITLAPLLGLPTTTRRSVPTTAASQQRLEDDWQALWKEWDRIIKETDDEDGRYLQNEISYSNLDLDTDTLVADLDKVAKKLLPLLPSHLASATAASFDLVRKLSTSLGKVSASHASYIILPDDVVSLGPALSKLTLAWLWETPACQTPAARLGKLGKLAAALFEGEPSFALDEKPSSRRWRRRSARSSDSGWRRTGRRSPGSRPSTTTGARARPSSLCCAPTGDAAGPPPPWPAPDHAWYPLAVGLRVLFLDFDGVLNTDTTEVPPGSDLWSAAQLDPLLVERLDRLVHRADARVVISSSWRKIHDLEALASLLASRGFSGEVVGVTPSLYRSADGVPVVRGDEVAHWLDHHAGVEGYAIVDDDELFLPHQEPHLVRTDARHGLTAIDAARLLECLHRPLSLGDGQA